MSEIDPCRDVGFPDEVVREAARAAFCGTVAPIVSPGAHRRSAGLSELPERLMLIVCLTALLLASPAFAQTGAPAGRAAGGALIRAGVPRNEPERQAESLPFTSADAVHYFSTVLEMSPEETPDGRVVFEHQHDPLPEDRWRIEVMTLAEMVIVEFTAGGDYGIELAREFFESPLFQRDEYEIFYGMLNDARHSPVEKMARFTVKMTLKESGKLQILTLQFSPRSS